MVIIEIDCVNNEDSKNVGFLKNGWRNNIESETETEMKIYLMCEAKTHKAP